MIKQLYGGSLALLTDLYQLTMAQGYWHAGRAQQQAVFHLVFRRIPFDGGFAVTCGQSAMMEYLDAFGFDEGDCEYLARLTGSDGQRLFRDEFLEHLGRMSLDVEVLAMPEGTVAFAHEPIVRVTGPIWQCQLLETPLLNLINFPTLVATKAARVALAAGDQPVLEFGLRRSQGIDGGVTASRSAVVGGCSSTSNVLAGKLFGLDVKGTHAHSWVMSFGSEIESFEAWAQAMPNNAIFLVDTYDSLAGVRKVLDIGKALGQRGYDLTGVRLDSGDLAWLSKRTREILDEAGFKSTKIVASGDLDEYLIQSLHRQGAQIDIWGVGTKLATAYDQPALGGVYKLAAVRPDAQSPWQRRLKLSERKAKMSDPGVLQVRRFSRDGHFVSDAIYDVHAGLGTDEAGTTIVDPADETRRKIIQPDLEYQDLLEPVYSDGRLQAEPPTTQASRQRAREQIGCLDGTIKRFENPHEYPAGLTRNLHELKTELIGQARQKAQKKGAEDG